jgi:hypothetical protein
MTSAEEVAFAKQVEAACEGELSKLKGAARVYYLEAFIRYLFKYHPVLKGLKPSFFAFTSPVCFRVQRRLV